MLYLVIHEPKYGKSHLKTYIKVVEANTAAAAIRSALESPQGVYFEEDRDYTKTKAVTVQVDQIFFF